MGVTSVQLRAQYVLELEMAGMGVQRYRKAIASAIDGERESETKYGVSLLRSSIDPVAEAIREFFAKVEGRTAGIEPVAYKYLKMVDDLDTAALIMVKTAINTVAEGIKLPACSMKVGWALEYQVRFSAFKKDNPALFNVVLRDLNKRTSSTDWKRKVMASSAVKDGQMWTPWPARDRLILGSKCIDLVMQATGMFWIERKQKTTGGKVTRTNWLRITEATKGKIEDLNEAAELMTPAYLPTVVPPQNWVNPWKGGYFFSTTPCTVVKTRNSHYLEELANTPAMKDIYAALNIIQRTPYKINGPVLAAARMVWKMPNQQGVLPAREAAPLPPKPRGLGEDKAKLTEWKHAACRVHEANAKLASRRSQSDSTLGLAWKFKDHEAIYFPHQLDFRGRVYSLPMFLNPQSDDLARGLLTFARGKPIGNSRNHGWLCIHGANCFGFDKGSLEERIGWVQEREDQIIETGMDPTGHLWWTDAAKPWQFLAFCIEYMEFQKVGYDFVSHLPITLDGSCNGLQHFSAMLRDPVGGAAVNLIPGKEPQDIYQQVADRVTNKLKAIAGYAQESKEAGIEAGKAFQWLQFGVSRAMCKRPVMVLPYGGTMYSCRQYIIDEILDQAGNYEGQPTPKSRDPRPDKSPWEGDEIFGAASFLAIIMWEAIGEIVVSAREAMGWLRKATKVCVEEDLPIRWITPDGFNVVQAYPELRALRVNTVFGDTLIKQSLLVPEFDKFAKKLDAKRQINGVSPNFVHSMDGTALRLYVRIAADMGVENFTVIHDCFGCLAADTDVSSQALRQAFVDMYLGQDVLQDFRDQLLMLLPPERQGALPPLPKRGDLNLEAVLEAEYFFA